MFGTGTYDENDFLFQMYDVDSVLEEHLFPHPVQGGSGMSMQDVDQGFCSQMSTNQVDLKSN